VSTVLGKCHFHEGIVEIEYCPACQHFFCEDCRRRYWARGLAAVKQMIGGRRKGCCGIIER
jgi:hypothetical protein